MTSRRRPLREAARIVRSASGTSHLPAVTVMQFSTLAPCWCAGCSKRIEARGEMVLSSRDCDVTSAFDVHYCSAACRAAVVK